MEIICGSQYCKSIRPITFIEHLKKQGKQIMLRILCVLFVMGAFLLTSCVIDPFRPEIEQATIEQIDQCKDFGPILSLEVYSYVHSYQWRGDVNDLIKIDGIGPKRIKELKYKFK